jgi:hypothetical protein
MHMDISLYEQQVEELNRKLTFQRSRYLKEEYEHYRITDMQYSVLSYIQQHPCTTIGSVGTAHRCRQYVGSLQKAGAQRLSDSQKKGTG